MIDEIQEGIEEVAEERENEYDSGPFCRHWHDPLDCEEKCLSCGHRCGIHGNTECNECDCTEWKESE